MEDLANSKEPLYTKITRAIYILGELFSLYIDTLKASLSKPFYFIRLVEQLKMIGIGSLSITVVIGLSIGFVMTLNFGYGLAKFGGTLYVPAMVSLSVARELAPIFTSLVVAGRVGSGIAAEIGSMNVTQQVDAIRALGTNPVRVLVVPRFWATIISLPLLTALSNALALFAGLLVCQNEFDMPAGFYMNKVLSTVKLEDFLSGLFKASFFGGIIALVGCYKGLTTKDGTKGVGSSTTWVVVYSSILILLFDFIISKLYLLLWT